MKTIEQKFWPVLAPVLASLLALQGCGQLLQPDVETRLVELREGSYQVDPSHTTVLFKVEHLGLAKFVGRFNEFEAQLEYDPENPSAARLSALIDMTSVDVNNADLEESLRGRTWFNTGRYPRARFETTAVELLGNSNARFTGQLTFRGVTAPVTLDVHFNGGAFDMLSGHYTLGFAATGVIHRSDFGMDQFIPAVGDAVELEIHAEFQRR